MFDDFKEKTCEEVQKNKELHEAKALSPQVAEKLKHEGIDPKNCTLQQLFPEEVDNEGNDLSLISGAEWAVFVNYAKMRKYLIEKYPQTQQESKRLGIVWDEPPEEPLQIDVGKAQKDPRSQFFFTTLVQMKVIYEKLDVLKAQSLEYEKICLRLYHHVTLNWTYAPNVDSFRKCLPDSDIFEIVEAYFKICRKYHVPTLEEPYQFLSEEQKRNVKLEGDMLRRTTDYSDNEIHISILEAFA